MVKLTAKNCSLDDYAEMIRRVDGMATDQQVQSLAKKYGLHVLNVTWEDTGRFKDSAVEPNISDMTIQVQHRIPGTDRFELTCMPAQIIRVYQDADSVGSIVVEGDTGRPTEHTGPKFEPPDWWEQFWERHFAITGQTRDEAIQMLESLLGPEWINRGESDAERALQDREAEAASDRSKQ